MKQEEKELLLKDLCARLPYGVFCEGITKDLDIDTDSYYDNKVKGVLSDIQHYKCDYATLGLMSDCELETIRPYLFPLSSMSETLKDELADELIELEIKVLGDEIPHSVVATFEIDFYHKHHIDYRGLIPMGLAIDATGLNIYTKLSTLIEQ